MKRDRYLEAAALSLGGNDGEPPRLSAVGQEDVAARIVGLARRYGIPVVEEPELCEALVELPLDQRIPQELYRAAAIVMAKIGALRR